MASNLITSLPESLSNSVLSAWLNVRQLARLDSAFCHRAFRRPLLNLFQSNELINEQIWLVTEVNVFEWLLLRELKMSKFSFVHDVRQNTQLDVLKTYFERYERHVRKIICYSSANEVMRVLASHCRHLAHLTCNLPAPGYLADLAAIFRNNTHLEEVVCSTSQASCNPELFDGIKLPLLTAITLSILSSADDSVSSVLVGIAPSLRRLSITSLSQVPVPTLPSVARLCPHLRSLELRSPVVDDTQLQIFAAFCPHIINLSVGHNKTLTDAGILGTMRNLRDLRTLCLQNCSLLTDLSIRHISDYCARTLTLLYVESKHFTLLALNALQAASGAQLTIHSRCAIYKEVQIKNCSTATVLALDFTLSMEFVLKLGECCTRLNILDLSGCSALILDVNIVQLLRDCCPNLRTIVLKPRDRDAYRKLFVTSGFKVVLDCPEMRYVLEQMPT